MQDWDDAPGAIDWPRFRSFLSGVKETGVIPESHKSHDHLNEQKEVPLDPETREYWRSTFTTIVDESRKRNEDVVWALVDGFLLYWDKVS